jgi:hypothetical protein
LKTLALGTLLFTLLLSGLALAQDNSDAEIQYLLEFVASSGCSFTRNGSTHDSADAADHLRLKYSNGKKYAGSADQFIDRLASKSSWTGKAYTVDCQGEGQTSNTWLHRALDDYRQRKTAAAADTQATAATPG